MIVTSYKKSRFDKIVTSNENKVIGEMSDPSGPEFPANSSD